MPLSGASSGVSVFEEGLAHLAAGRWGEAVSTLKVAAQREPGRLAVVRALATACLQAGDVAQARAAVMGLTSAQPMCAEGWRLAAQLEWKLNQYDDAMAILARGLDHLPNSQILHRQTALFWGARGKLETSARHAGRAGEASKVGTYLAAAQGGDGKGLFDAANATDLNASDWFDRVAQDPGLLESLLNLPGDEADMSMLKGLETKLAALLESQPHHADRQLVLARLQIKIDNMPAAMLSVQRALRTNPNYIQAHRLKANILEKIGEPQQAIDVLEKLIARGVDWADIHYQVAELQSKKGQPEAARSHLYSAIRLNPKFERAQQLLERCAA